MKGSTYKLTPSENAPMTATVGGVTVGVHSVRGDPFGTPAVETADGMRTADAGSLKWLASGKWRKIKAGGLSPPVPDPARHTRWDHVRHPDKKIQHKSKHCADESEAEAFIAKLPKKAQANGIIERAYGEDGSVVVSASWESNPVNTERHKPHPVWDLMIPPSEFYRSKTVRYDECEAGDIIGLKGTGQDPPPLSWGLRVSHIDESGALHVEGGAAPIPNGWALNGKTTTVYRFDVPDGYLSRHHVELDPYKVPGGTCFTEPRPQRAA